jgi:hypothetical protein
MTVERRRRRRRRQLTRRSMQNFPLEEEEEEEEEKENVLENWDDWQMDEAWGDGIETSSSSSSVVVGFVESNIVYSKATKSSNRSDSSAEVLKGVTAAEEEEEEDEEEAKRKYYLGYDAEDDQKMIDFWREYYPTIKDYDVANMMKLGMKHARLRDASLVVDVDQKLNALLPGVHALNVLQRCPHIIEKFDFGKASRRILEIQDVLCSEEMCHDVVDIVEKTPDLLLCESVYEEREKTIEKLNRMCNCTDTYEGGEIAKGKKIDAERTVAEYPELLYRLKEYDSYYDLPVSILNMLSGPNEDEILDEDYDQMWDENMGVVATKSGEMSYEEWQNDGYWEKEEKQGKD